MAMIKMMVLLKRKPGITREEFQHHWRTTHARLVQSLPELTRHMTRYVQNHIISGDSEAAKILGGLSAPDSTFDFDGIFEGWYESVDDLKKMTMSKRFDEIIRPDELKFLDHSKSIMYLVDENPVYGPENPPRA
jgi:uncharacterized protein (TIGR02118 family)